MTGRGLRLALAVALLGTAPSSARAAEPQHALAVPLPPVQAVPAAPEALPPYQDKIDRLAELMGTLAFLRSLCGAPDGGGWRARMEALLEAEGTTAVRRERLAGSFNRGYTGYQLSYHACTPAADAAIARALGEGGKIAADVAARFGSP